MNFENRRSMNSQGTRGIIVTALMIALIFLGGSIIKIPTQNGIIQFGDCMIFVAAILLDRKKAFIAAAVGMSFVDISAGYLIWVPFTFIIKGLMGYVVSVIVSKSNLKTVYIIAFIVGGIINMVGYFIGNALMGGVILKVVSGFAASITYAIVHFPGDLFQTIVGIVIAIPLALVVKRIIK
ncbi:MAG: ECF transporter S component [Sarcina sp.]